MKTLKNTFLFGSCLIVFLLFSPAYSSDLSFEKEFTVRDAGFIDKIPDYSKDDNADSDNYFLREDGDYKDIDIFYRIPQEDIEVSNVLIKIYEGATANIIEELEGEKSGNEFKTGENLHVQWDAPQTLANSDPGFYRVQLEVYADNQPDPVCLTSIDDADGDPSNGWQCPQDCLAIHDLAWKHRLLINVHTQEDGEPCTIDEFMEESEYRLKRVKSELVEFPPDSGIYGEQRVPEVVVDNLKDVEAAKHNQDYFWDLFDDNQATIGEWSKFSVDERGGLTLDTGAEAVYHSTNRGGTSNFIFLQYWMFSNFSRRPFINGPWWFDPDIQHESDLEHCQIAVRLKDNNIPSDKSKWIQPFGATASQHYYAQTLKWDINDGSASNFSINQNHVEHRDNRLVVYIALGAHATYFLAADKINVPDWSGYLGTQDQYDLLIDGAYDRTGSVDEVERYDYKLKPLAGWLEIFEGRWGYYDSEKTGPLEKFENGVPGPPHRAAKRSNGTNLNLRNNPIELHNLAIRDGQEAEMTIE